MITGVADILLVITYYTQRRYSPLHCAAGNDSKECLELLLLHGADVNIKTRVSNIN